MGLVPRIVSAREDEDDGKEDSKAEHRSRLFSPVTTAMTIFLDA